MENHYRATRYIISWTLWSRANLQPSPNLISLEGMKQQVKEFIKKSSTCQLSKTLNKNVKEPMIITITSLYAFEKVFMDIVGSLLRSHRNNPYIIILQDDLTKFS